MLNCDSAVGHLLRSETTSTPEIALCSLKLTIIFWHSLVKGMELRLAMVTAKCTLFCEQMMSTSSCRRLTSVNLLPNLSYFFMFSAIVRRYLSFFSFMYFFRPRRALSIKQIKQLSTEIFFFHFVDTVPTPRGTREPPGCNGGNVPIPLSIIVLRGKRQPRLYTPSAEMR